MLHLFIYIVNFCIYCAIKETFCFIIYLKNKFGILLVWDINSDSIKGGIHKERPHQGGGGRGVWEWFSQKRQIRTSTKFDF